MTGEPIVYDNFLVLLYEPEMPQETWGFVERAEPRTIAPHAKADKKLTFVNTPHVFRMEARVRLLSFMPPLKQDGTAFWRVNNGLKMEHLPYRAMVECDGEWVPMAILATMRLHRLIQQAYHDYAIQDSDVANHIWRIFKGHRKGYDMGQWGLAYLQHDTWEGLIQPEDCRQPSENSPWILIPNALTAAKDIQRKVLPYFEGAPREDIYIRELRQRCPCEYHEARALYLTRQQVGLP